MNEDLGKNACKSEMSFPYMYKVRFYLCPLLWLHLPMSVRRHACCRCFYTVCPAASLIAGHVRTISSTFRDLPLSQVPRGFYSRCLNFQFKTNIKYMWSLSYHCLSNFYINIESNAKNDELAIGKSGYWHIAYPAHGGCTSTFCPIRNFEVT